MNRLKLQNWTGVRYPAPPPIKLITTNKNEKIMDLYLTRQHNGLYMLTKYKPIFVKVEGKEFEDAYVVPGEPVGIRNFCSFILSVVGLDKPLKRGESIIVNMTGKVVEGH